MLSRTSGNISDISYERNIDTLLFDSINFLLIADEKIVSDETYHSACRASGTFTLLLLEAVANCCISNLDLERSIHKEIDRLPVLSKFDFYLRAKFKNRKLDRSHHQVSCVKELKSIRDVLVHLKAYKSEWEVISDTERQSEASNYEILDVSQNIKFWYIQDVTNIFNATHGFLEFFFKDCCKYSKQKVSSILFSESRVAGDDDYAIPLFNRDFKNVLEKYDIKPTYLKLVWA